MAASKTTPPLTEALAQNQAATAEVKKAAEQLAVIHAVLETNGAKDANEGDVAQAIAQTHQVEKQLDRSAEKLDHVNDVLKQEVHDRRPAA